MGIIFQSISYISRIQKLWNFSYSQRSNEPASNSHEIKNSTFNHKKWTRKKINLSYSSISGRLICFMPGELFTSFDSTFSAIQNFCFPEQWAIGTDSERERKPRDSILSAQFDDDDDYPVCQTLTKTMNI